MSDLLMDYCTELIKTQYPIKSKGSNDPAVSSKVTLGPIQWWLSALSPFYPFADKRRMKGVWLLAHYARLHAANVVLSAACNFSKHWTERNTKKEKIFLDKELCSF